VSPSPRISAAGRNYFSLTVAECAGAHRRRADVDRREGLTHKNRALIWLIIGWPPRSASLAPSMAFCGLGDVAAQKREPRYVRGMSALKARVENGRIKLDEPTDLPEGQIVELIPLDEVIATDGDDLGDAERAALHRSIDESIEDEEAGKVEDLSKIIAELRAQL
jgi:hypothetical protein